MKQGKEKGVPTVSESNANSAGTLDPAAEPTRGPREASLLAVNSVTKAAHKLTHMQTHSFKNRKGRITEATQQSETGVTADEKAGDPASGR